MCTEEIEKRMHAVFVVKHFSREVAIKELNAIPDGLG